VRAWAHGQHPTISSVAMTTAPIASTNARSRRSNISVVLWEDRDGGYRAAVARMEPVRP
jgi:hypothetical protein